MSYVFTRALQRSQTSASAIQSKPPNPIPLGPVLILFTHVRLDLPSGHFTSGLPINIPLDRATSKMQFTGLTINSCLK
jgi:hypothetical protein